MNYVLWAIKDHLRGIEPDSCTLLEPVVNVLRMRYSTIGVSGKTNFLDIPPFFTYCRLPFFLVQQIKGYVDRNNVKTPRGMDIQARFMDTQVLN